MQRPLKKGSCFMALKHVAFAPECPKQLGSRLRLSSPYLRDCFVASLLTTPAQPFSRFFTIQPSPSRDEKKGTGYFFSKKEKVSTHGQNNRKSSLSPFSPSMSERRELRRRREERMENGVKNLKGARLFPKTFPTMELEMLTFFRKMFE